MWNYCHILFSDFAGWYMYFFIWNANKFLATFKFLWVISCQAGGVAAMLLVEVSWSKLSFFPSEFFPIPFRGFLAHLGCFSHTVAIKQELFFPWYKRWEIFLRKIKELWNYVRIGNIGMLVACDFCLLLKWYLALGVQNHPWTALGNCDWIQKIYSDFQVSQPQRHKVWWCFPRLEQLVWVCEADYHTYIYWILCDILSRIYIDGLATLILCPIQYDASGYRLHQTFFKWYFLDHESFVNSWWPIGFVPTSYMCGFCWSLDSIKLCLVIDIISGPRYHIACGNRY